MPTKEIKYTDHALERMEERGIPKFKGATVAGDQMLEFIKKAHPFKTENYNSIRRDSEIVYWVKISALKKGGYKDAYIYVSTYIEIGVLLVITVWKIDYTDYEEYLKTLKAG